MLPIDKSRVMVEHYRKPTLVSETGVRATMKSYRIAVDGEQLYTLVLGKNEILLEGSVQSLVFICEKQKGFRSWSIKNAGPLR